jgi:twitching motility protein PilT
LKAAMRQDPDILFVWEIRDRETAEAVLNLAETWHLVFSTLHTNSAANTINRFISFFPTDIQSSIAERISEVLLWIQSQKLVKNIDWSSRVWVFELLLNNSSIKNNIKQRDIDQIESIMETSSSVWMITLAQYANMLADQWVINKSEIENLINKKDTIV